MTQVLNHDQFRKAGINSIFLGNFLNENELEEFLSQKFPIDFGFEIYPPNGPAMYMCEYIPERKLVSFI